MREYGYAADLGKSILPVLVAEGISTNLLPPVLSQIQFVDYRKQDRAAVFRLARAFTTVPPSRPLPDPLPAHPEVPLSYLGSLTEQVGTTSTLSYAEQSTLIVDLKRSLRDPKLNDDVRTLLAGLRKRRDLFSTIAEEIDELLRSTGKVSSDSPIAARPEPFAYETSNLVSGKLPLKTRLATASCVGVVGVICMALALYIYEDSKINRGELLEVVNPLLLPFGFVTWAIAGAITGKNWGAIVFAFSVAIAGFVVAYNAYSHAPDNLIFGMVWGAPGAILGAIVGVIQKPKG
jgi:hypothetical protein